MAERRLRLTFENALDPMKEVHLSIPRADDTKSGAIVKAAMEAISDNYEMWTLDIGAAKKAAFVTPAIYDAVNLG